MLNIMKRDTWTKSTQVSKLVMLKIEIQLQVTKTEVHIVLPLVYYNQTSRTIMLVAGSYMYTIAYLTIQAIQAIEN